MFQFVGASAVMVMFGIENPTSLQAVPKWHKGK